MTNYYDGARAKEYWRARQAPYLPVPPVRRSEPTVGDMLKLYELWGDGRIELLDVEQNDLQERIYSAFFGHFDAAEEAEGRARARVDDIMDAELVDDDS